MKIIEKKCPNCGAQLSFDSDDTEARCNYCGQEFIIEKDIKDTTKKMSEEMIAKSFKLHKKVFKAVGTVQIVATVIFLVIFASAFVFIFSSAFKQMSGTPSVKIEQIDDNTLGMIHSSSLDKLKEWSGFTSVYTKGEYEYVGFYIYKDDFYTRLADVFKTTYISKKGDDKVDIYVAVKYKNVEYKDGKVSLDYNGTVTMNTISLGSSMFDNVYGYRSLEELYNKAIFSEAKGKIYASEGMYQ